MADLKKTNKGVLGLGWSELARRSLDQIAVVCAQDSVPEPHESKYKQQKQVQLFQ